MLRSIGQLNALDNRHAGKVIGQHLRCRQSGHAAADHDGVLTDEAA